MEVLYDINKAKIESMLSGFRDLGINENTQISEQEISYFLNHRSRGGQFDQALGSKLFQILNEETSSQMTIKEFINNFLLFEEDLKKNSDFFERKLQEEREIYLNLEEKCRRYKTEKLNSEGFCENAKIYGEITDVDIRRKLEGIKEIIIIVVYNEKIEEIKFVIGGLNSNATLHKKFEFKPKSRNDHFEFIMKGVNDKGQIFDIGNKIFQLKDVNSQEEYSVQIIIPEIDDEDSIAAYINGKIVLYWSDYEFYENQRKKAEKKLKKLIDASSKAKEYLLKVKDIYGNLLEKKPDILVDFNNEKLIQRNNRKILVNINDYNEEKSSKLSSKVSDKKVKVEFNNKKEIPKKIEFNNEKTVIKTRPVQIETEKKLLKIDPVQVLEKHRPPVIVDNTKNVIYGKEENINQNLQKIITTQIIKEPISSVKVNPPIVANKQSVIYNGTFGQTNVEEEMTHSSQNVVNNNVINSNFANYENGNVYNENENQAFYNNEYNQFQQTTEMNQNIVQQSIRPPVIERSIKPTIYQNSQRERITNSSTSQTHYELTTKQPIITSKVLPTKYLPVQTRQAVYTSKTSPTKFYNREINVENLHYPNNITIIQNEEINGIGGPFLNNVNFSGEQYNEDNGRISTKVVNYNNEQIVDPLTGVVIGPEMS